MTKARKPRSTYTRRFKLEETRLMNESNRPSLEVAIELDIRSNELY